MVLFRRKKIEIRMVVFLLTFFMVSQGVFVFADSDRIPHQQSDPLSW